MARITFSPLVAAASGKAADAVFSSWKGIAYVRKLVTPKNPNSAAQQTVRNSMGRIPPLWRSLETKIKTVQDTYASSYNLSGYNWFGKQNRVLEETHNSVNVCPPNTSIDRVATITLTDLGGGSLKVDWTGGTTGADYDIHILSRDNTAGFEATVFVVESAGGVLVSAGTETITVPASKDYDIIVTVENTVTGDFSQSQSDSISMGA